MTNPFETPSLETSSQEEPELKKQNWRAKLEKLAPGQLILLLLIFYAISFAFSYLALFVIISQGLSDATLLISSFVFSSISLINISVTIFTLITLRTSRWCLGVVPCLFIEIAMLMWYSLVFQPDSEIVYLWVTGIWLRGVMFACMLGSLLTIVLIISDLWRRQSLTRLHWIGVWSLTLYYVIAYLGHIANLSIANGRL